MTQPILTCIDFFLPRTAKKLYSCNGYSMLRPSIFPKAIFYNYKGKNGRDHQVSSVVILRHLAISSTPQRVPSARPSKAYYLQVKKEKSSSLKPDFFLQWNSIFFVDITRLFLSSLTNVQKGRLLRILRNNLMALTSRKIPRDLIYPALIKKNAEAISRINFPVKKLAYSVR